MFNVTVINIKKTAKHIIIIFFILAIIFILSRNLSKFKTNEILKINLSEKLISCLTIEIPAISTIYYKNNTTIIEDVEEEQINIIEQLLEVELAQVKEKEQHNIDNNIEIAENSNDTENSEDNAINTDIPESSQTEIVTQNPISESYNVEIGGLYHPEWKSNLKFAIEIQKKANEMYPGLFKPMIVRNSRYNQHLGKAACIIEVGATGNTLEQCLNSMKYLAKVFEEYGK